MPTIWLTCLSPTSTIYHVSHSVYFFSLNKINLRFTLTLTHPYIPSVMMSNDPHDLSWDPPPFWETSSWGRNLRIKEEILNLKSSGHTPLKCREHPWIIATPELHALVTWGQCESAGKTGTKLCSSTCSSDPSNCPSININTPQQQVAISPWDTVHSLP